MDRADTMRLLKFLATAFPTMKVTNDVIDTWELAMCGENARRLQLAAIRLAKTRTESAFMPTIGTVLAAAKELEQDVVTTSAECWARGPRLPKTELESEAWRQWGGYQRWAFLPDPRYADDHEEAQRTLSFARREFIELYESIGESREKNQNRISHAESVALLEQFGLLGNIKSIGGEHAKTQK